MLKYLGFIYLFFGLFHSLSLFAQEDKKPISTIFDLTNSVHRKLEALKNIPGENYLDTIDNYREDLEKFFEQKKGVCEGEFSSVILDGIGKKTVKTEEDPANDATNKLRPEERKLCFRELKALQLTFINNSYEARKRYLNFLHEKSLKGLDLSREKAVKSLQLSFDKKSPARRR